MSPAAEAPQTEKAGQTTPVLCSPLIVHKEGDASYQPDAVEDGMTATHTEDELEAPTIERHRFRKKKKNHKGAYVLILLLVAVVAVCAALYFTGTYDFGLKPKETSTQAGVISICAGAFVSCSGRFFSSFMGIPPIWWF